MRGSGGITTEENPMTSPTELLRLRTALAVFLAELDPVDQWAEQAADVNRLVNPGYAGGLDRLRDELRAARNARESGTPASLYAVVAELLGES
jgi:hypothetical protein